MNTVKSRYAHFIKRKETHLSFVIFLAGITLIGWVFNYVSLAAFSSGFKPISPIVAVTFIALSVLLLIKESSDKSWLKNTAVKFSIILIALFYTTIFVSYFFLSGLNIENILIVNLNRYGSSRTGIMSPVASGLFIAICLSILLIRQNRSETFKYIGGSLLLMSFLLSSLLLLGYLYRAPLLFGSNIIPVALPAAICFWVLSITLLRETELKYWTFNRINKNETEVLLLKSFIPLVILIVIVQELFTMIFADAVMSHTLSIVIVLFIILPIAILIVIKMSSVIGVTLRSAQQTLKEYESKLLILQYSRSLIEASLDPLVTIDVNGKISDVNQATEIATGLTREILIGTDFSDYFTEPEKARIGYQKVFAEGTVIDYPLTIRNKSNTFIDVLYNASVYRNDNFEIIGVFAAARDITKIKQTEEGLEKVNHELSFQLREKAKRAEELVIANKELETFSYSVSHDLRAPLRHINGYVDLLLSRFYDSLPEKARHYLDTIADSSRQMGTLIDDLLQFSRIGRQEKRLADFDMNVIVNEVLAIIKQDNPSRNIEWRIPTLPEVYADKAMLQLVWMNLLSNAVKFTRAREKAIIGINVSNKNNEYEFSVHDNGVGFDMQYSHKLFGVFQRLHPTAEFEGTGIGLANVQHIISRHGGRTWAEAEPDKGATFYFSLSHKKEN